MVMSRSFCALSDDFDKFSGAVGFVDFFNRLVQSNVYVLPSHLLEASLYRSV